MRSSWMRNIITTSASFTASSIRVVTRAPAWLRPGGMSVAGAHAHTSAPSFDSSSRFERSTRLCIKSPTIATFNPLRRPFRSRIVNASSSACVGCSCIPSPAFTIRARQIRDKRWHAPADGWRSTIMLGDIASKFIAVSTSVSPLTTLEVAMATLRVSALRRFSAISNEVRVRVLGSKNRLMTVRPRSVGTFLMARWPTSFIASAVLRINTISSGLRSAIPSRCFVRSAVSVGAGVAAVRASSRLRSLSAEAP